MRTRDQRLAASAFKRVSARQGPDASKYGTMALKLPALVRSAGLAQALAFADAKGHDALLDDLAATVLTDLPGSASRATRHDLLGRSRDAPLPEYIRLTRDVLGALQWYKRFAQSVLDADPTKDDGQ